MGLGTVKAKRKRHTRREWKTSLSRQALRSNRLISKMKLPWDDSLLPVKMNGPTNPCLFFIAPAHVEMHSLWTSLAGPEEVELPRLNTPSSAVHAPMRKLSPANIVFPCQC
ncbi:unnamed protein product, partial [Discosporangium mesarthrocarpum]